MRVAFKYAFGISVFLLLYGGITYRKDLNAYVRGPNAADVQVIDQAVQATFSNVRRTRQDGLPGYAFSTDKVQSVSLLFNKGQGKMWGEIVPLDSGLPVHEYKRTVISNRATRTPSMLIDSLSFLNGKYSLTMSVAIEPPSQQRLEEVEAEFKRLLTDFSHKVGS